MTSESFGNEKFPFVDCDDEDFGKINETSISFFSDDADEDGCCSCSSGTKWQISLLSGFRPRFREFEMLDDDDDVDNWCWTA